MNLLQVIAASKRRANYRAAVLADSPVAYWRLGEASGTNAADEVGSYAGTYSGTYALNQTGAISDGNPAVGFSGSDGRMTASPQNSVASAQKVTLEGWIYRPASGSGQIFGFSNTDKYLCYIEWFTDNKLYFFTSGGSANAYGYVAANLTGWHHVALVFDGSSAGNARIAAYIDGSAATLTYSNTIPSAFPSAANLGNFVVGRMISGTRNTTGRIDEVAIYPTALSAARILAHYNAR